ncbi:LPP20 family lipoprotein [Calditrichota bacterium GD2]
MRVFKITSFVILLTALVFAQKSRPDWIENRPLVKGYYVGIGYASKIEHPTDYHKVAMDNALSNLASEIQINISSQTVQKVLERAGILQDEFKSYVQSSTKAELEGYELVDKWENDLEYWVYYRLSREKYEALKNARLAKARALAVDMLQRARSAEENGKIDRALLFYFQALPPIEKYLGEPLQTEINGQQVFLFNEIYSSLQRILSEIKLQALNPQLKGKLGQPVSQPLTVKATRSDLPVQNLPIAFAFVRGAGDLIKEAFTDARGEAHSRILKINANDNLQIVVADLAIEKSISQTNLSPLLKGITNTLVRPSTRFMINVSGLTAYIESQEVNLGRTVEIKQLEPALKNILSDKGFTFSDSPVDVDFIIKIKATARKGAEMYGLYSSFVNLTFSVIDMRSGQEIYKNVLENVKGIDLNYEKAGFKALSNAAKAINEKLIPDFLRKIQKN